MRSAVSYGFRTVFCWCVVLTTCHGFIVLTPPQLAGIVQHVSAQWGPPLGAFDYTVQLSLANPQDACNALVPLVNASFAGQALLVLRGGCPFSQKAQNVAASGAVFMVLGNNDPQGSLFPMMMAPGSSSSSAALSAMVSFNDYVRLGAVLSHVNTARGFDRIAAFLDKYFSTHAVNENALSSIDTESITQSIASRARAALLSLRESQYAARSSVEQFTVNDGKSADVEMNSDSSQLVMVRTTTVGEYYTAWSNYWNGLPPGDDPFFGNRPWIFWVFPITLLVVMQLYCCTRCVRSGMWARFQRRFGFGGDNDAENIPVAAGVVPAPALGGANAEADEAAEIAAAVAAINASEARVLANANAHGAASGSTARPSYGALMATLPPSMGSVNNGSESHGRAVGGYMRMPDSDVDEKEASRASEF